MLEQEFQYFVEHQYELVKSYNNKYIVIKDQQVVADFYSVISAYKFALKNFPIGSFLIKHCVERELTFMQPAQ